MERTMTVEEKIRRAEEIYLKRQGENTNKTQRVPVNNTEKKDIKLLKKLIKQIIICVIIYITIYTIQNSQTIFSQDFIKKTKEILEYDTNFIQIYDTIKSKLNKQNTEQLNNEQTQEQQEEQQEEIPNETEAIGGGEEPQEQNQQPSQEEQDIINTQNTTSFIKPIEGTITSTFGYRETATGSVPKNHTGTDIAANTGTKIKSATEGEVVLSSEEGDYGKHLKIQIGEVSIIYAHCNNLYVKQGDHVTQGQEIAEVGSTGNSTGPHLHFEIRYQERKIDPQKILSL